MKTIGSISVGVSVTVLLCGILMNSGMAQDRPYPVEYYYKVQWGYFDEFMELYKRNHYPILVKLKGKGDILDMSAAYPTYHAGEGTRWDFRFTIVWKDVNTAFREDRGEDEIVQTLYPETETFVKEERRRFQLLLQHLDVPVQRDDLSDWQKTP